MHKNHPAVRKMIWTWITLLVIVGSGQAATISNGEYTVIVAIDRATAEDKPFIDSIKTMMRDASSYLHTATKQQTIFKKVIIVVPDFWSDDPSYFPAGAESEALADIIVGKNIDGAYATPGKIFIDDESMSGDTVVHEWGHYRWGLGDEYCDYQEKEDGKYYQIYKTAAGWNRCTALQTIERDCEERPTDGAPCNDTKNEVNGAKASIMHRQWNPGIDSFCDKSADNKYKHNSTVNNHQNRIHNRMSCWEVIDAHADGIKMKGGTAIAYVAPVFEVKKAGKAEVMLVLDVSASMEGDPIRNAAAAAKMFVDRVDTGTWIGVVSFSTTSTLLLGLTKVTDEASRATIKAAIPIETINLTCIGCGMQTALDELNTSPRSMKQVMNLLTDGEENVRPWISEVLPSVVAAGVVVNTIGLGAAADPKLQEVSKKTGGAFYFAQNGDQKALSDAFITIANQTNPVPSSTIQSTSASVVSGGTKTLTAELDNSIGRNTVFNIVFSTINLANAAVTLTQPDGVVLDNTYPGYSADAATRVITFAISGTADEGTWGVNITNNDPSDTTVNLQVTSSSLAGTSPITLTARMESSNVSFPNPAIVRASLFSREGIILANVYADVNNPDGTTTRIQLMDNGQGADSFPLDGDYAAYYTGYTDSGKYSVQVYADNSKGTAQVGSQFNDNPGMQSDLKVTAKEGNHLWSQRNLMIAREMSNLNNLLTTNFQRTTSAGGFDLSGWFAGDHNPPCQIKTLGVAGQDATSILLTWLAPGDDLDAGKAESYDLRYSTKLITNDADFNSAVKVTGVDAPKKAGSLETYTVIKLTEGTKYYFAIKAIDDEGNTSPLSNVYLAIPTSDDTGGGGGGGGGGCFITTVHKH